MATNKKYYWLKLKDGFFTDKKIKKLRKIAGGDTYTIIYLKMQLLSLKNDGFIMFDDLESEFYEEIALEIDEDEENVKITLMYLLKVGLVEEVNEKSLAMIETIDNIGRESDSAKRVRALRERQKESKALQCNVTEVTSNTEIELEKEKELELEKELDNKKVSKPKSNNNMPEEMIELIMNYLNEKLQSRYSKSDTTVGLLNTLYKKHKDISVYQFVIDNKYNEWINDEEMVKYLRPSTLFAKSKFESYMEQMVINQPKPPKNSYNGNQRQLNPWEVAAYGQEPGRTSYDDDRSIVQQQIKIEQPKFNI